MDNNTDILIYQVEDGSTKIDVRLENETVWMTQKSIAELYQKLFDYEPIKAFRCITRKADDDSEINEDDEVKKLVFLQFQMIFCL